MVKDLILHAYNCFATKHTYWSDVPHGLKDICQWQTKFKKTKHNFHFQQKSTQLAPNIIQAMQTIFLLQPIQNGF